MKKLKNIEKTIFVMLAILITLFLALIFCVDPAAAEDESDRAPVARVVLLYKARGAKEIARAAGSKTRKGFSSSIKTESIPQPPPDSVTIETPVLRPPGGYEPIPIVCGINNDLVCESRSGR